MSEKVRFVAAMDRLGDWGVADLSNGMFAAFAGGSLADAYKTIEMMKDGDLEWRWNACSAHGVDIDVLRRRSGWESDATTEKTFKIGDRVRVSNDVLSCFGKTGTVVDIADDGDLRVELDGESKRRKFITTSLTHDQPRRLPQVGEVWRSRNGKFTVKLELNTVLTTSKDGYLLAGHCSDGSHRTFTAEGAYWNNGSYDKSDLIELVSEAQPEQPTQPQQYDCTNPSHYKQHPSGVECITITEGFNFNIGNAVKYLWRAGLKGAAIDDLRKAAWYVNREIERLSNDSSN